jgi:anthranilate synthase/aminodeoxychorismate synthase-like glutamine amidotransferase
MLLFIENFDSFSYNIIEIFLSLGIEVEVYENDKFSLDQIKKLNPKYIVIGPGPKEPKDAGISKECIKYFSNKNIPILGICLGHQAIGEVFGSKIIRSKKQMHGKCVKITHTKSHIFKNIKNNISVCRYNSLVIDPNNFSKDLQILATCENGEIMAICHKKYPIYGVQFHPESYFSEYGTKVLSNFITLFQQPNHEYKHQNQHLEHPPL